MANLSRSSLSCGRKAIWRPKQDTIRTIVTEWKMVARTTCTCKLHMHSGRNSNRKSTTRKEEAMAKTTKGKKTKEANIRRRSTLVGRCVFETAGILDNNTRATTTKQNCVHTRSTHYTATPRHDTICTYRYGTDLRHRFLYGGQRKIIILWRTWRQ